MIKFYKMNHILYPQFQLSFNSTQSYTEILFQIWKYRFFWYHNK